MKSTRRWQQLLLNSLAIILGNALYSLTVALFLEPAGLKMCIRDSSLPVPAPCARSGRVAEPMPLLPMFRRKSCRSTGKPLPDVYKRHLQTDSDFLFDCHCLRLLKKLILP